MKQAPRKFDLALVQSIKLQDTPKVLASRYPHLTRAEHERRNYIAVHEAGHLIIALIGITRGVANIGPTAFIRVPRSNSPKYSMRGADGEVACTSYVTRVKATMHLAGMLASVFHFAKLAGCRVRDLDKATTAEVRRGGVDDVKHFKKAAKEYSDENGLGYEDSKEVLARESASTIKNHWHTVEELAVALLLHADATGLVNGRRFDGLVDYYARRLAFI